MSKSKFGIKKINQSGEQKPEIHKLESINKEERVGTKKFLITTVLGLSLLNGCSNNTADSVKPVTTVPASTVKNSPTTTAPSSKPFVLPPPATTMPETTAPTKNVNPPDICTCDHTGVGGGGSICSCDKICTCNLIYY